MRQVGCAKRVIRVAVNAVPVSGSWGGGNQWLGQMLQAFRTLGIEVKFDLTSPDLDLIWILHSADWLGGTFGRKDILRYRQNNPRTRVIHRVNENDARKASQSGPTQGRSMDEAIRAINECADETVFIADWLKEYHRTRGLNHVGVGPVIWNGAGSGAFHPVRGNIWPGGNAPLVLITHHWSDHWNKGFDIYRDVDEAISNGELKGFELRVLGRWPKEITWKSARALPPHSGASLGEQLRLAHAYLTASRAEPGGMHFIEGLQCGLPLLYHAEGGGIVEVARASAGLEFSNMGELCLRLEELRGQYGAIREKVLMNRPSGERMVAQYLDIMFRVLGKGA